MSPRTVIVGTRSRRLRIGASARYSIRLICSSGTLRPSAVASDKSASRAGSNRCAPAARASISTVRMSSRTCVAGTPLSRSCSCWAADRSRVDTAGRARPARYLRAKASWPARGALLSRLPRLTLPIETNAGYDAWRDSQAQGEPFPQIVPEDIVVQLYTSGTTGRPKGAMLSHRALLAFRSLPPEI